MKKLYIAVTLDKYELPLAVADTPAELARLMGTTCNSVLSSIAHGEKRYKRVLIEENADYEKDSNSKCGSCSYFLKDNSKYKCRGECTNEFRQTHHPALYNNIRSGSSRACRFYRRKER